MFRSTVFAVFIVLSSATLAEDHDDALKTKLESAITADIRTAEEQARDKNRLPLETLTFFGLQDDMKLVELLPGGGWYTKLLAPLMAENGDFTVALGTGRVEEALAGKPGFENMNVAGKDAEFDRAEGARFYEIKMTGLGVDQADMVLTFRNYHNFSAAGRSAMNLAVFAALKSGGIYGVVDHTARHMEPENGENRRRMDPVKAIMEIQAAGFELVDFSDLHYRPDDELRYEVGRKTVTGNTDRWALKFRKP